MLLTDSYKASHWKQYPEGTQTVYSYLESRGGKFDNTVFFGLLPYLKKYLEGQVVTMEKIDEAEKLINAHMGPGTFNRAGWEYILTKHDGRLPVKIRAVKEGTPVDTSNVLMTVENTDPECFWLTNYLETLLLQVWYPITVATLSRECKKLILEHLRATSDHPNLESLNASLNFKLHDFGFRGVSSVESAEIGGAAHLVNFLGSDTLATISFINENYGEGMPAFSIPASEHSTITSWGRFYEKDAMENMLDQYPTGPVACVSDSYDIQNACEIIWPSLKDKILARDGVLVVRPDSGDIKMTLQVVLSALWKNFGGRVTEDGYKILDPHIRVIQGDGMNYDSLKEILSYLRTIGFSIENVAFGMGGALLQKLDRDTQKFAFKCSAIKIKDEWHDVFKSPTEIDAEGNRSASFKKSKRGRLSLIRTENGFQTKVREDEPLVGDCLRTVFEDGEVKPDGDFKDVRRRAALV